LAAFVLAACGADDGPDTGSTTPAGVTSELEPRVQAAKERLDERRTSAADAVSAAKRSAREKVQQAERRAEARLREVEEKVGVAGGGAGE
jgi:hypothetical protein